MYLISDLKNDLEGLGHGTSVSDITNLDQMIWRAARQVLSDVDPPETKRISELTGGVFDQVYRYACMTDLKQDKIIDIRPQASRTLDDNFEATRGLQFDLYKTLKQSTSIEYDDGTRYLKIAKVLNRGLLLNECESLTANGAWAGSGGATNLSVDTLYYINGGSSLKFDVGATGGYVENSTMTQIDLTTHEKTASLFVWIYIPTSAAVTALTSVTLRWGNDSSNYYTASATANFDSTDFHIGWNLLQFTWPSSSTGTVTATAYDYLRLTLTTTASVVGFRVDSFYSRLPSIYEVVYYSGFLFRDAITGIFSEQIVNDTDIINLGSAGYNLLVNQCGLQAALQRGSEGSVDMNYFKGIYENDIKKYNIKYPSESLPIVATYYRPR